MRYNCPPNSPAVELPRVLTRGGNKPILSVVNQYGLEVQRLNPETEVGINMVDALLIPGTSVTDYDEETGVEKVHISQQYLGQH